MIKKYKAERYGKPVIRQVEVQSETEHFIVLPHRPRRRVAKIGDYESFHNSFAEAKAHLIEKQEAKIHEWEMELRYAQDVLGEIKGLKESGND